MCLHNAHHDPLVIGMLTARQHEWTSCTTTRIEPTVWTIEWCDHCSEIAELDTSPITIRVRPESVDPFVCIGMHGTSHTNGCTLYKVERWRGRARTIPRIINELVVGSRVEQSTGWIKLDQIVQHAGEIRIKLFCARIIVAVVWTRDNGASELDASSCETN